MPADLHLAVEAVQVVDRARGKQPDAVARPVEPRPGTLAERVRHKAFRCESGPPQVAARQTVAADHELAGHAGWGQDTGRRPR